MKNISDVNDLLSLNNNITAKKKNPIISIIMGIVGIALLVYALNIEGNYNFSSGLLTIGTALVLVSAIGIFKKSKLPYYTPTGEKLVCKQHFFGLNKKKEIVERINNKDLGNFEASSSDNNSALMVIVYSTPSGSCKVAQILEYVDYMYAPLNEPVICQ